MTDANKSLDSTEWAGAHSASQLDVGRKMNEEELLPPGIQRRAIVSGKERGWRRKDIPEVVDAARRSGLACLGGQVQIISDGTCELYWRNYDVDEMRPGEKWNDFVKRSAAECLDRIERIGSDDDILREEVESYPHLKAQKEQGVDLSDRVFYIMYFQKPTGQQGAGGNE